MRVIPVLEICTFWGCLTFEFDDISGGRPGSGRSRQIIHQRNLAFIGIVHDRPFPHPQWRPPRTERCAAKANRAPGVWPGHKDLAWDAHSASPRRTQSPLASRPNSPRCRAAGVAASFCAIERWSDGLRESVLLVSCYLRRPLGRPGRPPEGYRRDRSASCASCLPSVSRAACVCAKCHRRSISR